MIAMKNVSNQYIYEINVEGAKSIGKKAGHVWFFLAHRRVFILI